MMEEKDTLALLVSRHVRDISPGVPTPLTLSKAGESRVLHIAQARAARSKPPQPLERRFA